MHRRGSSPLENGVHSPFANSSRQASSPRPVSSAARRSSTLDALPKRIEEGEPDSPVEGRAFIGTSGGSRSIRNSIAVESDSLDGKKVSGAKKAAKLLRKIRSRTLLPEEDVNNGGIPASGNHAGINESTDSLVSTSTRDSSLSVKGRWVNNTFDKAIPNWLASKTKRDPASSYPDGRATDSSSPTDAASKRLTSPRTLETSLPGPTDAEEEHREVLRNQTEQGLPTRLSGWFMNVMGSEVPQERGSKKNERPNGDGEVGSEFPHAGGDRGENGDGGSKGKAVGRKNSVPSFSNSSLPKTTTKTPGLLASLSSSARARAAAATGAVAATAGLELPAGPEQEDIWLLGVRHGPSVSEYTLEQPSGGSTSQGPSSIGAVSPTSTPADPANATRRDVSRDNVLPALSVDTSRIQRQRSASVMDKSPSMKEYASNDWQDQFQLDFSSLIWCSYRNQFPPIARDGVISDSAARAAAVSASAASDSQEGSRSPHAASLTSGGSTTLSDSQNSASSINSRGGWLGKKLGEVGASGESLVHNYALGSSLLPHSSSQASTSGPSPDASSATMSLSEKMGITGIWGRATAAVQAAGFAGRSGLTTDAGWGCMLRTGQSLLANALIDIHLGRQWRRASPHSRRAVGCEEPQEKRLRATYTQILSWFMDDPSTACPFGIHRMAREGKRLGKEVGEWFGPSTAAGAIKRLVDEYPQAGLGVSLASDGVVYLSEVKAEARHTTRLSTMTVTDQGSSSWQRPVLILIGLRLGLEGVNAMYHDAIKAIFAFPQTVGIAGGRPSSSYYFVGQQGDSLFYLDPHTVRSAVPYRHPPPGVGFMSSCNLTSRGDEPGLFSSQDGDDWWSSAYSDSELATFHCDRAKRMPMRSLDPSMLLGFLVKDEASLADFTTRVRALPKAIFAIQDELPRWMREDDEDDFGGSEGEAAPSLESFSESSFAADDDEEEEEGGREVGSSKIYSSEKGEDKLHNGGYSSEAGDTDMLDEGYQSDATRPVGRGSAPLPDIQVSSSAIGNRLAGPTSLAMDGLRQIFPMMKAPSTEQEQTSPSGGSSTEPAHKPEHSSSHSGGQQDLETPRFQSDLRFPSATSTSTAISPNRKSPGAPSMPRSESEQFLSISSSVASEDNGASAIGVADRPSPLSTLAPSKQNIEERQDEPPSSSVSSRAVAASSRNASEALRPSLPSAADSTFGTSWEEVSPHPLEGRSYLGADPAHDLPTPRAEHQDVSGDASYLSLGPPHQQLQGRRARHERGSESYVDLGRRGSSQAAPADQHDQAREAIVEGRAGGERRRRDEQDAEDEGWSPLPPTFDEER